MPKRPLEPPSAAPPASGAATPPKKNKRRKLKAEVAADPAEEEATPAPAQEEAVANPGASSVKKKKRRRAEADDREKTVDPSTKEETEAPAREEAPSNRKKKKKKAVDPEAAALGKSTEDAAPGKEVGAVDRTVFIDGVPYVWSLEKLKEVFAECGTVEEVRAPTWQDSGRLRGFAHVTFDTVAARDKALKKDGMKVAAKGRFLKIEKAKQAQEKAAPVEVPSWARRLFCKNLPYDAGEKEIGDLFKACGAVKEVRIATSFGRSKGFAYVEFVKPEGLAAAMALQPTLNGRKLILDFDAGKGPKAGYHAPKSAFESGFGPKRTGGSGGSGGGKGKGKGKGQGRGGAKKLQLF